MRIVLPTFEQNKIDKCNEEKQLLTYLTIRLHALHKIQNESKFRSHKYMPFVPTPTEEALSKI